MLNLAEYRQRSDRLADHLPWAALVAPGVVLNKDGSFQRSLAYRGPDLESATSAELVAACARMNNVLRQFGHGWALFFHAERREAAHYPHSAFPDRASLLVDLERRAAFEGRQGQYFESLHHLTLTYLPPADQLRSMEAAFVSGPDRQSGRDWRRELDGFIAQTDRAIDLMASFMPQVTPLDDAQTLTFLHDAISTRRHGLRAPETPIYLDAILADTPLSGGLEPRLGAHCLRTLTVLGFPSHSQPAILDSLNHLALAYRWSTRFLPMDRTLAAKALTSLRRQWFNKRKSIGGLLREVLYGEPTTLLDSDADNKAADADLALQVLGGDEVTFGYLTSTVTVSDPDPQRADEKLRQVETAITGLGFTCIRESLNAVEAWLGSLPGHLYANVRQPLVHSLNLAHLMPLSSAWAGPSHNDHLQGPPLLQAVTSGSTPFRLSTHLGDVGHMMVVGPTGAGKSVLLALMALQFRRYSDAQVFIFDKGGSCKAAVLAMDGRHTDLAGQGEPMFQPLARIDEPAERAWAAEWLVSLLAGQHMTITPQVRETLWACLCSLASAPEAERSLTGLRLLCPSAEISAALAPYSLAGALGGLLDGASEALDISTVHAFEAESLMENAAAVGPVLTYLFHRLEDHFDGRPTLVIIDEAWVFLDHPLFAARIREWLRVLRKKNVSVIFATQSLADVADSPIAPALIESCPQRIFLPNPRACEPQTQAVYERFGLNQRQIDTIARALPKRHYYLQSRLGSRLFELGLGPIALALCAASSPPVQALIDAIFHQEGPKGFLRGFLIGRGLGDVVGAQTGLKAGLRGALP